MAAFNPDSLETSPIGKHDPEFDLEDGNMVLSAKDKENCTTYFPHCVHSSILVKHSPVFADMFTMPPPPTTDKYNGVSLVEMPDDADALRDFIALLYDPERISGILDNVNFTLLLFHSTLLANKYQVDWICTRVASQLRKQWPTSIGGWDKITGEEDEDLGRSLACAWDDPECHDPTLKLHQFPEPVTAIHLARECNTPTILPFAFLHLFRLPLEPDDEEPHVTPWAVERALISQDDMERLAITRERIGNMHSVPGKIAEVVCDAKRLPSASGSTSLKAFPEMGMLCRALDGLDIIWTARAPV
ncbi:hypothetical protein FB451DRAFT_1018292 [Mycena latifolia]|nr:hypothetical protein FB451DRAFT_1018292 [Mycena latifolia]